jgi:hypothetical protein
MTYTHVMSHRLATFVLPVAWVIGLVEALNLLEAGPGVAVAALTATAVVGGVTLGYFADRLPDLAPRNPAGRA